MSKQIVWSELADSDINKILDYLSANWSEKVISDFINELDLLVNSTLPK